jgi:hypothetical protein
VVALCIYKYSFYSGNVLRTGKITRRRPEEPFYSKNILVEAGGLDMRISKYEIITPKQLIWYGHVERMDPTRLPKIMINWKPEGRRNRGRPRRNWKCGI